MIVETTKKYHKYVIISLLVYLLIFLFRLKPTVHLF